MTGQFTVLLGGQKSGKSGFAARRAIASGCPVVVVTPAVIRDDEFKSRVERHRRDRPADWTTLETFDLVAALAESGQDAFVIVDAFDTWLAERLESSGVLIGDEPPSLDQRAATERDVVAAVHEFTSAAAGHDGDVVVIAGQPGLGAHAVGAGARFYVDLHGLCVQALGDAADEMLFVMGGRAVPLERDPAAGAEPISDLREHGDTQVPEGVIDLAVNVQPGPPLWLAEQLVAGVHDLAAYPDERSAQAAAAARHGRPPEDCLVVNGAAEAFWLLGHALRPRRAVCVHPSFTEPEAALRAQGVPVTRVMRSADHGWALPVNDVPENADLIVLGRPDNPTGALDPMTTIERLVRPGRVVVVDEAFAEFLDDPDGLAGRRDLPGLVSVRSLTKLWGLAGLRVGYVVGPQTVISRLRAARQPWSCNSLALAAVSSLVDAEPERSARALDVARVRAELVAGLGTVPGLEVWDSPANFVLLRAPVAGLRDRLLDHGLAARRADTFPGLDDRFVRVAVRDPATNGHLVDVLSKIISTSPNDLAPYG